MFGRGRTHHAALRENQHLAGQVFISLRSHLLLISKNRKPNVTIETLAQTAKGRASRRSEGQTSLVSEVFRDTRDVSL